MPSHVARALSEFERNARGALVMTDPEVCERYAADESEALPCTPAAVVRARSEDDVVALMSACFRHEVPVTPRGGGTGRTGGAVPVEGGIVLAFEGMDALEEVHRGDLVAVVRPGLVLGRLHDAVEAEGLFYGPDPNSLASCALGGNLAENAGGPRALKYGATRDWTLGLDVVTADGTRLALGKRTGKGVTGYDLAALVVGSEGTLAVITRAFWPDAPASKLITPEFSSIPVDPSVPADKRVITVFPAVFGAAPRLIVPRLVE